MPKSENNENPPPEKGTLKPDAAYIQKSENAVQGIAKKNKGSFFAASLLGAGWPPHKILFLLIKFVFDHFSQLVRKFTASAHQTPLLEIKFSFTDQTQDKEKL